MEKFYFLLTEANEELVKDNFSRFHFYNLDHRISPVTSEDIFKSPIDFNNLLLSPSGQNNYTLSVLAQKNYHAPQFNPKTKIDFSSIVVNENFNHGKLRKIINGDVCVRFNYGLNKFCDFLADNNFESHCFYSSFVEGTFSASTDIYSNIISREKKDFIDKFRGLFK